MSTSPDQDSGPAVAAKVATVATAAAAAAVASDPTAVPVVATAAATAPTAAETNELSDSNDHEYALEPTSSYGSSSYVSSDDDEYDDDDYDEDEDDTDGETVEYLSDAQAEWEESIAQIQSLLTCILIPVVGKFFGRRFSYFGTCVLTASFFFFVYLFGFCWFGVGFLGGSRYRTVCGWYTDCFRNPFHITDIYQFLH